MGKDLLIRERIVLIILFTFFTVLVIVAFTGKDVVDPDIQNFLKREKNENSGNFDCTK